MHFLKNRRKKRERMEGIYTFQTPESTGRTLVLAHVSIFNVINWLTTGLFYTSFLMIYGIDIVNIGIISFVPYIASCFSLFSPSILERFKKRKVFLGATRLLYYVLNIFAITIIPEIIQDANARIVAFVMVIFLSNVINALTGSGYTVWHIKFVPVAMRADYFAIQSVVSGSIGIGVSLISSIIADSLAASPYQATVVIILRYVAFVLAMIDTAVLMLPKEYPYEQTKKPKLKDIFTLPFKEKPFLLTMCALFIYTFAINIPASAMNYYLLNDVGVKYSLSAGINMIYPLIQVLLLPFAKRYVAKHGWFPTFAFFVLLNAPTLIMYSCVTAGNYLWLYTVVRLLQHFTGVYYNLANSNLIYANLPPTDQSNYLSFHTLITNLAAFLGMMTGTGFIAWGKNLSLDLLGMRFSSVQMLNWAEALGIVVVAVFIFTNIKTLTKNNN